jgi:hypothetical protein
MAVDARCLLRIILGLGLLAKPWFRPGNFNLCLEQEGYRRHGGNTPILPRAGGSQLRVGCRLLPLFQGNTPAPVEVDL